MIRGICGASDHPNALEYMQRVKKLLIIIILDDVNFNIFLLKKCLQIRAQVNIAPFNPDERKLQFITLDDDQIEAMDAGLYSIAGYKSDHFINNFLQNIIFKIL